MEETFEFKPSVVSPLIQKLLKMNTEERRQYLSEHSKRSCRKCYGRGTVGILNNTTLLVCKCVK